MFVISYFTYILYCTKIISVFILTVFLIIILIKLCYINFDSKSRIFILIRLVFIVAAFFYFVLTAFFKKFKIIGLLLGC